MNKENLSELELLKIGGSFGSKKAMTQQQFIRRFLEILENEYGKPHYTSITISRAVEVIKEIFNEE